MNIGKENSAEEYQETEDVYARLQELEQETRQIGSPEELKGFPAV